MSAQMLHIHRVGARKHSRKDPPPSIQNCEGEMNGSADCAKGSVACISQARHNEALLIQPPIDHASINP